MGHTRLMNDGSHSISASKLLSSALEEFFCDDALYKLTFTFTLANSVMCKEIQTVKPNFSSDKRITCTYSCPRVCNQVAQLSHTPRDVSCHYVLR